MLQHVELPWLTMAPAATPPLLPALLTMLPGTSQQARPCGCRRVQMEGRAKRHLRVTVRGAADVPSASSPYVVLQCGNSTLDTEATRTGGSNPIWDESIELQLPPPLPNEQPLPLKVKLMSHVRLFPDRFLCSGHTLLTDLFYGGGQHEVTVPLTDEDGKPAGHLHLGLLMEKVAGPGEQIGSAAGTVLGEVPGGHGPSSPTAAAVPGPVLPSASTAEVQAREVLGAGYVMDPSKPGFGLHV